ncbi:CaiB/BaiF CoA-transferase family protein [Streptomyces sp. NPDC002734]|uniref:CaiB/BaiF CoA-transferase family protein n=1 Tax=Streptomyces sp. NPDC002734 TaxID=3154426 RepID=UPI00331EDCF2
MGPARGLWVVEPAAIGPVPFACMMPAGLGADVVRVDRAERARPFAPGHRVLDRGRRSVALDLRSGPVVEALLRLVERSDVLVGGFRPGVAERLGVGPEQCAARNPGLVHVRVTGWGQDGPLSGARGHDINDIALSGALHAFGGVGGPLVGPVDLLGDFAGGGLLLVVGVFVVLHEGQRSGLGQVVDAAVADGSAAVFGMLMGMAGAGQWPEGRGRNLLDGGALFYGVCACADGGHVAVGALEERFSRALLAGLGLDGEALGDRGDPARWPGLRARFAERFASRTRDRWAEALRGHRGLCVPGAHHRGGRRPCAPRGAGHLPPGGECAGARPAPRFTRTAAVFPGPAPQPGGHAREVPAGCGRAPEEIVGRPRGLLTAAG